MLSLILFQRIAELFVIIFFGWLIVKVGILKSEDSRCLSMILLYIIAPSVFFNAFQIERTPEVLSMMAFSAVLALISNVLLILLGDLSAKLLHLDVVEEASIIYPNSGNMAIPLVSAIFGTEWVVFVTLYNMIQNPLPYVRQRGAEGVPAEDPAEYKYSGDFSRRADVLPEHSAAGDCP